MDAHPEVELHSLMLLRNGHVVTEGWWAPYTPERVHLLYSLSKSFASTAAGFAVAEGLLDLDRTVLSYFPELDADVTDERSRSMLVRHVAAMASGHDTETIEQVFASDPADLVRGFLRIPPEHEPGSWFAYNQPCTYTLAAIVQRESGQGLVDYLTPRLFAPLGIGRVGLAAAPAGPRPRLHRSARHHRRHRQARSALPAARVGGATASCCPRSGSTRRPASQVANPREETRTGARGTASSSGWPGTATAATGRTGSSASCCPSSRPWWRSPAPSIDMQAVLDGLWTHLLPALERRPPLQPRQDRRRRAPGPPDELA